MISGNVLTMRTVLLTAIVMISGLAASATPIQIFSRDALNANDFVDWGQLPPPITILGEDVWVSSHNALMPVHASSSHELYSDQQGNPWAGNFSPGDALIGTGQFFPAAPIEITFDKPVRGLATQVGYNIISEDSFPFTAYLKLFDPNGALLGSFTADGNMNNHADNSAVVLGAIDTEASIARVELFASAECAPGAFHNSFTINRLDLLIDVPEPTTLIPVMLAMTLFITYRRLVVKARRA